MPVSPLAPSFAYDTTDLIGVVPTLLRPQSFLLDRYFPKVYLSDTETVAIDVQFGKRRMTPFVSPLVEGKVVEQLGRRMKVFNPPYLKDKRVPDLRAPLKRALGERLLGEGTGQEREMNNIIAILQDQVEMLTRREEWMAAQALTTGTITVSGEGFEAALIDFGRSSNLTMALTSQYQWTKANVVVAGDVPGTVSPSVDVDTWAHMVLRESGANLTDIIFTTSAWDIFRQDPLVKNLIYFPKLNDFGNAINNTPNVILGAAYKGRYGQYDLWLYNDWAVDDNDVQQPIIPDGMILLASPQIEGTRAYAQIVDPYFNYATMRYAPKTWVQDDPAQRFMMMQSAPLPIPFRPDACMSVQVCPPNPLYN